MEFPWWPILYINSILATPLIKIHKMQFADSVSFISNDKSNKLNQKGNGLYRSNEGIG